jgi:E3 ubiquitin-protein ligase HUWE1
VEDAGLTFANGEEVTTQNAHRYIEQETRRIVFESIQLQMHAIATGFYEVLSYGSTAYLTVDEVLNVLRGEPNIDINDLRASTTYTPSSTVNEHTIYIVWFWDIVYDFSQDERRDLVQFVSGSPLTPIDGFTGSERNREWFQIAFDDGLTLDQVPQAQTCFKQIRIPRYTSSEIMRTRLLMAIQNAKTLERA